MSPFFPGLPCHLTSLPLKIWGYIAKKMVGKCFLSKDDVWAEVQKQWAEVPRAYIHSLYDSMPSRLLAVQQAKGHPTKYQVLPNLTVV